MKPNTLDYSIRVRGLFGRNRTHKAESFDLVRAPIAEPKKLEDLRTLAQTKLREIRAKPGCTYAIQETPIEVNEGEGFKTMSFMVLSGKTLEKGVVGEAA